MNQKTTRLLRRYAVIKGQKPREARRFWKLLRRYQRHEARQVMQGEITELE